MLLQRTAALALCNWSKAYAKNVVYDHYFKTAPFAVFFDLLEDKGQAAEFCNKGTRIMNHDQKNQETRDRFYVTTPIYYVTARPHLGSLYSTLLADVLARWNKLGGKQVFFLTGTDEHGQKIAQAAEKVGQQPKAFVDSFIEAYHHMWDRYELSYNHFIRTTDSYHVKAVQAWLSSLLDKGDIYKSFYKGWYCTPCETFLTDKDALVEQAGQIPACPSCSRPTQIVEEETYFFKLSNYASRLLTFYQENPDFIQPKERMHEVINFVASGLKDLSISRTTITWGIPFPGDAKHVTYVWADALNNYITAVGYGQPDRKQEFESWWPADVQVLGKDIVRFHAVYWPAFLMASGLPLPKRLLVHGWIRMDKQKMSKSLGNVVDPQELYDAYGAEPVRYYLMRQMAITHDSDFSIEDLEQRITSDLANDLGNLLNRTVALAHSHSIVELPVITVWSPKALDVRDECLNMLEDVEKYMNDCSIHLALARIWKFINTANAYFHAQEPWKLIKKDPEACLQVLSVTCHSLRAIATLLWPVMPHKMEALLASIGAPLHLGEHTRDNLKLATWNKGFMLHQIQPLFVKPESKQASAKPMTEEKKQVAHPEPVCDQNGIGIEDFLKVELVVGTVEQCEPVPNSSKLYALQVNFGERGMRQILAGFAPYHTCEALCNKQAVFLFNLKPRAMVGMQSQGMLLAAQDAHGVPHPVIAPVPVPNGTRLR